MLLTKYGLREWLTATVVAAALALVFGWLSWWWAVALTTLMWLAVVLFFRSPLRRVPRGLPPEVMLAPADGRVMAVTGVERGAAVEGPATVIRIFLSVLNVHVNRAPGDGRVTSLQHTPGRYHDARSAQCPTENEAQLIGVKLEGGTTIGIRQVAGKIARRIVCDLRTGETMRRGEPFGMIKFGSCTELILPPDVEVHVRVGDKVKAGVTRVATLGAR